MKNKLLSVTALGFALTAPAFAADLPSLKAPVVVPPPALWTGFYAGLNAGGTFAESNAVLVTASPIASPFDAGILTALTGGLPTTAQSGFIGGGQIGYNYTFGPVLIGFETDIQGVAAGAGSAATTVAGSATTLAKTAVIANQNVTSSLDYLGTARGRIGYLATPTLLVYGTAGLAYGQAKLNASSAASYFLSGVLATADGFGAASVSDTRVGWTAGGGLEWLFLPHWSAKIEYLFYDLGSLTAQGQIATTTLATGAFSPSRSAATSYQARYNGNIIRAGLNYHFNWFAAPPPIVAKY